MSVGKNIDGTLGYMCAKCLALMRQSVCVKIVIVCVNMCTM